MGKFETQSTEDIMSTRQRISQICGNIGKNKPQKSIPFFFVCVYSLLQYLPALYWIVVEHADSNHQRVNAV